MEQAALRAHAPRMASWHAAIWTRRKVVGQDTSAGVTKDVGTMKASADISSAALQASPSRAILPCPRPGQSSYKYALPPRINPAILLEEKNLVCGRADLEDGLEGLREEGADALEAG